MGFWCRGLRLGWVIVFVAPLGLLLLFPRGSRLASQLSCRGGRAAVLYS